MSAPESVYCACGAQWHGRYATSANGIIALHRRRGGKCALMSHGWFKVAYRCMCEKCRATRRAARQAKRELALQNTGRYEVTRTAALLRAAAKGVI